MSRMSLQNEWNESTEEVGWVYRMSWWVYRMSGMITEWVEWLQNEWNESIEWVEWVQNEWNMSTEWVEWVQNECNTYRMNGMSLQNE